jgi:hypothetical protein
MIDEKNKNLSDNDHQPNTDGSLRAEPGQVTGQRTEDEEDTSTIDAEPAEAIDSARGVLLIDRPPRPGTIELKGPPGMAVSVAGNEWYTRIVIRLPIHQDGAGTP